MVREHDQRADHRRPRPLRRRSPGTAVPGVRDLRRLLGFASWVLGAVLLAAAGCTAWAVQAHADEALQITLAAAVVVLALLAMVLLVTVRRLMVVPITLLGRQVRRVTEGEFERSVEGTGPNEIVGLGEDVDLMRRRIIDEWTSANEARRMLDEHAEELRRSNAELEQFAYVASHDLQEPLRKVASFSRLLKRRYAGRLDERADAYLDFAADGADRMQAMVAGLLEFSRVGRRGHGAADGTAVDLTEAARQALASLATAREESGARVEILPLPTVRGDAVLLRQLLQNLIGNAIRFRGGEPPRIRLAARRAGDEWEFSCVDNGIGIDPEHAERIFVIFQRLHPREEYEGTGIGLSLCRKIVEHHGGRIWLDTSPRERGAVFRWTLPRWSATAYGDGE
ncbi:hypothetical protein BIV57_09455 [Mangrovactinospora gilvigrisea]|uniref:histidine kinase n=1 Tax=Mangrovactinospora gilvigrisea TaxID=1428644 RepID=A0A1J7CDQ0_9ACTN|nr:ATP-binding protein [Mangrovactinospora gilvigrisea]OIV37786.1 hypothetical protein BIV57_09455 [Mangrovactinospora gilvigrisea]